MTAAGATWRTDRSRLVRLIGLAGVVVAVGAILLDLGFFFRPGTSEVLGGLAHHAFVLALMLLLTAGSRTVSLSTLGVFWLIGVWSVFGLTYVLQSQLASLFGIDRDGNFMAIWVAPFTEEALKLAPVAIYLLLAARSGYRHPSMSDGLLLGFMVGAGVTFQEDAHYGEILGSGAGWGAATPWTTVFPTISPLDKYFALNHALWAALSGLGIGAAVMLRHWRWIWPIALAGPVLSFTNHLMANHFTTTEFGTQFLLRRASGGDVPWFYDTVRTLTDGGRLPMLILIAGAVVVVAVEWMILRWVTKQDRMFPPLPIARVFGLLGRSTSKTGAPQLLAAERYVSLRRSVYFAGWRTKRTGGSPGVIDVDVAELDSLAARLGLLREGTSRPPREGDAARLAVPGA
ncbi:MAG TPA: PrsW family glutamic-type intramembrane protease [Dehalococcoidia bacterium]|nr:PrsW family glutamic-type intramembrane protease [Dehalococcoidia bacterium]